MLNNYLLLLSSMLKTVVLLNMFVETNTIYIYMLFQTKAAIHCGNSQRMVFKR